jgi:ribonucleoside-triphosphate reductase
MQDLSVKVLSDVIHFMKYAKYLPEMKRRETWDETVQRNMDMHIKKYPALKKEIGAAYQFVFDKKVLPSMRSMQFGGKPIELNPARGYNCAFMHASDWEFFHELMFLLLGGSGVGYSVQTHHVAKLPEVKKPTKRRKRHLIGDSIEGWSDAIKVLIKSYFFGESNPEFDYSDIRPKGSYLKTSGGKAPGPQPLKDCIHNLRKILDAKEAGDKLTTLEVHDMACFIADAVLSGGIRRAAMLALFSFDDEEMLTCKFGNWWELNPQRARANNSVCILRHKVKKEQFLELWKKIEASKSGEP